MGKIFSSIVFWEALAKGLNWLFLILLSLLVNPEVLGITVVLLSYLLLISNVGVVGQNKVILRYVTRNSIEYLHHNITISIIATTFIFICVSFFIDLGIKSQFFLYVAALLYSLYTLLMAYARKIFSVVKYAKIRIYYTLTRLILGITFIVISENAAYYLLAEILSLTVALFVIPINKKRILEHKIDFTNEHFKKAIVFGMPLMIHALAAFSLGFSDRIILSFYVSKEDVGIYGGVYAYASSLTFVYAIIATAWEPKIYQESLLKKAEKLANKFMIQSLLLGSFCGLCVYMFYELILVKFNPLFSIYLNVFIWVLIGHLIMPFYFRMNYLLVRIEQTKYILYASLVAGMFNISLNLYLIPIYGIVAAGITTFLSYCVLSILSFVFYSIKRKNEIG